MLRPPPQLATEEQQQEEEANDAKTFRDLSKPVGALNEDPSDTHPTHI